MLSTNLSEEKVLEMFPQRNTFVMNDDDEDLVIDNDAKLRCDLFKKQDERGNTYYVGKLQFNGSLDLKDGQSFMIFVADDGSEELQIGPLEPHRANYNTQGGFYKNGRLCIRLKAHTDTNDNKFYVGEVRGVADIPCKKGIFFTIFTSIHGREELQIAELNTAKIKRKRSTKLEI